eukprot:9469346-Pyramimonas_sp.AAC.1
MARPMVAICPAREPYPLPSSLCSVALRRRAPPRDANIAALVNTPCAPSASVRFGHNCDSWSAGLPGEYDGGGGALRGPLRGGAVKVYGRERRPQGALRPRGAGEGGRPARGKLRVARAEAPAGHRPPLGGECKPPRDKTLNKRRTRKMK